MNNKSIITDVTFQGEDCVSVVATLDNGETQSIFRFYNDELSFTEEELIGLTVTEACELHHKRDVEYLQT